MNTKYFHKVASSLKSENNILGLNINGVCNSELRCIKHEISSYYSNMFKEDCAYRPVLDGLDFDAISSLE